MSSKFGHVAAWLLLAAVAFVTLAPIGWRPDSGFSPQVERLAAFALIGLAFSMAYPRHLLLVAVAVLGSAVALETLQFLVQGRHPGVRDVLAKLGGGSCGVLAGWLISTVRRRLSDAGKT